MVSNETFLFAAYVVTWVAILGYVWYLTQRVARARARYQASGGAFEEAGR